MNIDDRIKALASEIAAANAEADAFSRQADKNKVYAEQLEAEYEKNKQEIALLNSKIERVKRKDKTKR